MNEKQTRAKYTLEFKQEAVRQVKAGRAASVVAATLGMPAQLPAPDIRIELRRGATAITVTWPSEAAGACAAWMRELLR